MTNGTEVVSKKVFTVPNVISFTRLALVPIFGWLFVSGKNDRTALTVLFIIGSTDWVDGFVARRIGQVSVLGKLIDPVADRIAIVVVMLLFAFRGIVAWPVAAAILLRDLLVAIGFPILEVRGMPRIAVNIVGKGATLLIYFGMGWAMLSLVLTGTSAVLLRTMSLWFLMAGAVFYWIAGAMYVAEITKVSRGAL
ncbi:MAG: CDP-alcohol phosphatidyltransferase family protein [Actinobacteria bacterium]|nr:CDP-alcohol phosphatidyltransferase family protein [Actinomycetota bacterium]